MNIQSTQALATQPMRFVSRTDSAEAVVHRVDISKSSTESSTNMTADDAKQILDKTNTFFSKNGNLLRFELDQDAGKMVFYLKDSQTGETLRQIPDETILRISKNIDQFLETSQRQPSAQLDASALLSGLLTDTRA
jgi:uncharacterized FlaG/YvyC family protein